MTYNVSSWMLNPTIPCHNAMYYILKLQFFTMLESVNGHFARLPSHYWTSRSQGQTS